MQNCTRKDQELFSNVGELTSDIWFISVFSMDYFVEMCEDIINYQRNQK